MNGLELKKKLSKFVKCEVLADKYSREFYSLDSSSYQIKPIVIVFPRNEKEITKIVKFATRHHIQITPRGSGTGLVGSALGRGIIIDMKNLNKFSIRKDHVKIQGGTLKGNLDVALSRQHKFVGPSPSIGPYCTLGGMIATNASGKYSLKYGSIIDNLVQVKIITSNGSITLPSNDQRLKQITRVIPKNSKEKFPLVSKNSCGYRIDKVSSIKNTPKIISGSEGTLGIIVSAVLKIHDVPKKKVLVIISYKTLLDAAKDSLYLINTDPAALELVDKHIVSRMSIKMSEESNCLIFAEFHYNVDVESIRLKSRGRILKIVTDRKKIGKLWNFRDSALGYSLRNISKGQLLPTIIEDAVVPVKRLPMLIKLFDILTTKYNLKIITYGHIGNGNLHIRPLLKQKDKKIIKKIAREFFSGVISLGGSISGEHGDGLARTEFVKLQYDAKTYSTFKKIKKIFDPKDIFNPGKKIFKSHTLTKNLRN